MVPVLVVRAQERWEKVSGCSSHFPPFFLHGTLWLGRVVYFYCFRGVVGLKCHYCVPVWYTVNFKLLDTMKFDITRELTNQMLATSREY